LPPFAQRRNGGIRAISRAKPIFFEHIHSYAENIHSNAILVDPAMIIVAATVIDALALTAHDDERNATTINPLPK
jgi:hypothetical protein